MLKEVKNLKAVSTEMKYSEEEDADSVDYIDKVAAFWVKISYNWLQLKDILITYNELKAVCHVEWLESYNRKGSYFIILLPHCMKILCVQEAKLKYTFTCRCSFGCELFAKCS